MKIIVGDKEQAYVTLDVSVYDEHEEAFFAMLARDGRYRDNIWNNNDGSYTITPEAYDWWVWFFKNFDILERHHS